MTETCTETTTICGCLLETTTKVKINQDLELPKLFSVILFNDNVTTHEFVVITLVEVFGLSLEPALELTKSIHENGSGIAASGVTEELASHLCNIVRTRAALENFPLKVEVRAE